MLLGPAVVCYSEDKPSSEMKTLFNYQIEKLLVLWRTHHQFKKKTKKKIKTESMVLSKRN